MANTPTRNVGSYNEIVIQFGWLCFFSQVFPLGPFFCLIQVAIQISTETDKMSTYCRRNYPICSPSIGTFNQVLDLTNFLTVMINMYMIVFVSESLTAYFEDKPFIVICLVMTIFELFLQSCKKIVDYIIPDVGSWVTTDR